MGRRLLLALWRVVALLMAVPLLVGLAGAGYQAAADAHDRRVHPPPGRLVDIGGHRLHLHCTGVGSPTVVLETARGRPSVDWLLVAPGVAGDTRVCAYDRAGLGWSDSGPGPRTSDRLAAELHTLLQAAGERGPHVLVSYGHGAYTVRVYAARYPADVGGVVLVDPVPDEQLERFQVQPLWLAQTVWVAGALGIPRLKGGWTRHPLFPPEAWPVVTALGLRTAALHAAYAELAALEASAAQVRASRSAFPDIPLVVLTPGPPRPRPGVSAERLQAAGAAWQQYRDLHAETTRLSPRGRQVIAGASARPLPLVDPEAIVAAVRQVVAMR